MLFYGHQLAVLPAAGADAPEFADELEVGAEDSIGASGAAAVANSYVVDLSAQGIREVPLMPTQGFGIAMRFWLGRTEASSWRLMWRT